MRDCHQYLDWPRPYFIVTSQRILPQKTPLHEPLQLWALLPTITIPTLDSILSPLPRFIVSSFHVVLHSSVGLQRMALLPHHFFCTQSSFSWHGCTLNIINHVQTTSWIDIFLTLYNNCLRVFQPIIWLVSTCPIHIGMRLLYYFGEKKTSCCPSYKNPNGILSVEVTST
jgi:hypothetical protein